MAYIPNEWKDQVVQRPKTYQMNNNDDGSVTLVDSFGLVTELGTPVNEDYMNHIEQGIAGAAIRYYKTTETFKNNEVVLNINTEGGVELWKSLTDNNLGNPLTDIEKWQAVDLGNSSSSGSGLSMFDLVVKDHILSYEESKGLALQGSYVYKDAVPGSRYGYPDFYSRCVEEFEDDGNTLLSIKNNVSLVGAPVVDNGVLSGFSSTTWANLPKAFNPSNKNWEMFYKFKTGTIGTIQYILNTISAGYQPFDIRIGEDGKLQVASFINNTSTPLFSIIGTTALTPATDYYVKLAYNSVTGYELSLGTSKDNLLIEGTNNTTTAINSGSIPTLGADFNNDGNYFQGAFTGSIDLKECYIKIDNELWWSGATTATKNANGHIFYDIADKEVVDDWFDTYGIADFYGVDKENERIFLPRNNKFFQFTTDTTKVNDMVEAGLPNIEGTMLRDISEGSATGALKITNAYNGSMWAGSVAVTRMRDWSFDASLSNPIYGKSDTVQPPSSLKLLYYVVGNTNVQSAATDIVDVTTTENDTLPLFTGQYFDFKPNNPSWLKAGEQQDSGGIYTSCYNKLVQALTDNIWEIKVIDSTAMEEGTDYSEYWIVYQDAMRFRTPLTACKEIMPGNEITSSLGFSSNPTNTVESYTVPYNGYITITGYKTSTSNTLTVKLNGTIVSQTRALASGLSSESYFFARKGDIVTVSTDSTSTGWVIATQTITKATANGELYFKAASAVENIEILNVGQVMEELSNKVNVSNTSWAINACMPDYTAQTTFTLPDIGQTFTAPYDCLLFVSIFNAGAGNFELRYNNSNGGLIMFGSAGNNQVHVSQTAYLKKGWQIYRGGQIGYNQCYITPLIGAEGAN